MATNFKTKKTIYSDVDINLTKHPVNKDVTRKTNTNAVIRSIKNLVLTNYYERPMNPDLGGNVTALLFEPMTNFTALNIRNAIREVIENNEPRADLLDVFVTPDERNNQYTVDITFYVVNVEEPVSANIILQRVR